ncbi:MAG: hypothetical protein AAF718_13560 [Pseudomonadota bacterium]
MMDPKKFFGQVPELSLPTLTKEAEIAVYMVHNSRDPEDYFFLFDFEEFAEKSNQGWFVRPALRVFAGRDDFSRSIFAQEFRAVFAHEFDRLRAALGDKKGKRGWLNWNASIFMPFDLIGEIVANLVLATALSLGKSVFGGLQMPKLLKGKTEEAKLQEEIASTKRKVETALERIEVTLHPELYDHAYRDGPLGKISGLDREAWPLPAHVRQHLHDRESGSWWG